MKKITAVCLSSTLQRTVTFSDFRVNHVNRSEKYQIYASGKAVNSARVINQLEKGAVSVICPLGKENAERFMKLARLDELQVTGISVPGYIRECWTVLDRVNHTTTEIVVGEPVGSGDYSEAVRGLLDAVEESLKQNDALLLAGSRPGIWPEDMCARICRKASDAGRIIMADFWGEDLKRALEVCSPDIIKINEEEFCATFGYSFPIDSVQLKKAVCEQSIRLNNIIVVTRGKYPTYGADRGKLFEKPSEDVVIVNTTACGDSFSAGFLHEYLKAHDVAASLAKGSWCAARNAELECPGAIR